MGQCVRNYAPLIDHEELKRKREQELAAFNHLVGSLDLGEKPKDSWNEKIPEYERDAIRVIWERNGDPDD